MRKTVHLLAYVSSEEKLYYLNNDNELIETNFDDLDQLLSKQKINYVDNFDELFNPSNYLVSPFNSTDEFIKNSYFLTSHQEEIKN